MRVTFDWALDGAAWPGPLGRADHSFGEPWLGPMGMIDLLETRLGLGGRFDGSLERACRLIPGLRKRDGYWRRSFDTDPLGTARRLLRDRDELCMWGWTGEPVSPRLAELHAATAEASAGIPDRLMAITRALTVRSTDICSITSFTPRRFLPPMWQKVFEALGRSGVQLAEAVLERVAADGDLARTRTTPFTPEGDGRLCLLRRHGPLDSSDEVAAALAAFEQVNEVVVIGADAVLDQALARHGLPHVGAYAGPTLSSQLLLLVLKAAFQPVENADLHALLTADPGPIPRRVGARLIGALRSCGGRQTAEWQAALAAGLAQVEEDKRAEIEQRVTGLLQPDCGRDQDLALTALRQRLAILDKWARARVAFTSSLGDLVNAIGSFLEAVNLLGEATLSLHQLRKLWEGMGETSRLWRPAEAGLAAVAHPGAVLAPARAIIWWDFSRDRAASPERLLLFPADREGLRRAGIAAPDPTVTVAREAEAWRRPLSQAREALILVCPHTDGGNEPNHPHPFWDEISASLSDHALARRLERDVIIHLATARRADVPPRAFVAPSPQVTTSLPLALREVESPSSVEHLLGCSLAWALRYHADLRPGLATALPAVDRRLFGSVAHRILAQTLGTPFDSANAAAAAAEAIFDQQCNQLCEELALPQHQSERATLRRVVVASARKLVALAKKYGVRGMQTEVPCSATVDGQRLDGRFDLSWDGPPVILDLKWGKRRHVKEMEDGTAVQLAAYAAMRSAEGQEVETGFFVLRTQELLAERTGRLSEDATVKGDHRAGDVWAAVGASLRQRRESLAAGRLDAPGATGDKLKSSLTPAGLTLAPPCDACLFAVFCGRGEES